MNIQRLTFAPYELPFKKPLHTARGIISVRRGFVVAVHTDEGIGLGEVAPLEEFGTESWEEAEEELKSLRAEELKSQREISSRLTATRLGIEAAMRMIARSNVEEERTIRVNALISGSSVEEIWNAAQAAVKAGYKTLKVKVGTRAVRNDIEIVRVLRGTFPHIVLRADANSAWSFDEARQFAHGVTACDVEYIEDPLREPDTETLTVFRRNCDVPVACDDMVRGIDEIVLLIERKLCDVLILKPAVIGSFENLEKLSAKAKDAGMAVVITSLLESSLGLSYIAHCAAEFGTEGIAHGVGTAELLEKDTLTQPLIPQRGELAVPDLSALPQLLTPDLASQLKLLD